ncbi:MAG: hypothetical protein FJY91_01360 [Candidatus Harrisonbacteria bacterium]|nr:hypothetical protein [Candidatus Harrisonbacteria bacterium]
MPYEKILELVEGRRMDVSLFSLALITDDFLSYVEARRSSLAPGEIADFLEVAARLLLIKSRVLLHVPSDHEEEEEREVKQFEERVRRYKELKVFLKIFQGRWESKCWLFLRGEGEIKIKKNEGEYIAKNLVVDNLHIAMQDILLRERPEARVREVMQEEVVPLELFIGKVRDRLSLEAKVRFDELILEVSRAEKVATFMACLLLQNEGQARLMQKESFSQIVVERLA